MSVINDSKNVLPHSLTFRIYKTTQGRSGLEIYKRRVRRDYRVLIQYSTWNNIVNGGDPENLLDRYNEGYIVAIKPEEYFGNNYPNKSQDLNKKFVLGQTGFVFYTQKEEYDNFPPLTDEWRELYELSTRGRPGNEYKTWVGEYCCDIKNAGFQRISEICGKGKTDINAVKNKIKCEFNIEVNNVPQQRGIANYDFDYASSQMIENVQLQILYLMLVCEDEKGEKFCKYIKQNYGSLLDGKDTKQFLSNVKGDDYEKKFNEFFNELKQECERRELLDKQKLREINAWSNQLNRPICPLCSKPLMANQFFEGIEQQEGRKVADNTQRLVVLMHVDALRPGSLNHRVYNLGWGHNYCNTIQRDIDIKDVIKNLEEIVQSYSENISEGDGKK